MPVTETVEAVKKELKSKFVNPNIESWLSYHDYDISIQGGGMTILCYDHDSGCFRSRSGGSGWSDQDWTYLDEKQVNTCILNALKWISKDPRMNSVDIFEQIEQAEKL